eukprot:CAMPEP_0178436710 /NCGR_PEP_ID=MMETSP0689_2-20121128/34582_1 /TAXON_ID=160604 /ORGANISM="Amphidinium massartii, Strain CS-259" /LENGTH=60 /DNA_ID=CAMNT_0020058819 /DNA_START=685 /DNA_END=864 /DNA_ORIENTATION=-
MFGGAQEPDIICSRVLPRGGSTNRTVACLTRGAGRAGRSQEALRPTYASTSKAEAADPGA